MENQDPEHQAKLGQVDSRKKTQAKNLSLRNKLPIQKQDQSQSSVGELDSSANNSKANQNSPVTDNSVSTSSFRSSSAVMLTENNDSMCDFRSPVKDDEMNEALADFKVKPTILKSNKRLARKESKSVVSKKRRNRDTSSNVNQPSIESSFFKPQTTVKTAFLCPLCYKSYKDATTQHNHMKSCAAKNKISTDKLLKAVALQEKQANERKAMGLLAAPPIQPKKTISKKLISEKDPQLQLALALSMSLHEAQVTEEFEEAHLLAGEPCLPINAELAEDRRTTLQNFGFTTNKPLTASTSGKSRKKRPTGPTALQIRTQEERDRLITVRIAEVLMGDEAITQALLENVEKVINCQENIILKSRLLQSYYCVKDRLWDKTQQNLSDPSYFCNLLELSPCKVEPELEINEPEQGPSKLEIRNQDDKIPPDTVNGNSISAPTKLESHSKSSAIANKRAIVVKYKTDQNSAMNLSKDWSSMLGSSYMSDVLIIVKGNSHIYAHRVVFWARCYDILQDVTRNDPERRWEMQERILWPETNCFAAEAFLEYVYCGIINRNVSIFDHSDMLTEVRVLARKYRLKKLFAYLRDKANELKSQKSEISNQRLSNAETNLESNTSDKSSSQLSEDESTISSIETDINSVSTMCNDLPLKKPVTDELSSDSDDVERRNFESMNVQEKESVSHNLVVDCFSSSNDSFAIQIPTTSSTKTMYEKLSEKRISERLSTNIIIAPANTIDTERTTNDDAVRNDDTNCKLMNRTFDEERCTSPDIFDDSANASAVYTYTAPKEHGCNFEHDTDCSDAAIEIVSTSSKSLQIESSDLNENSDKTADMSQGNNSRQSEKPKVDCTFVSTRRRKRRSSKPLPAEVNNVDLESDDLVQGKKVAASCSKKKGDITLAIEKIQRLNAKTASESDSESESVETFLIKKHKNPFRINLTNTSSIIEVIGKDDLYSGSDNKIPAKRRNKLSIFEKKIELEAAKNPIMFNLTTHKSVSDSYSKKTRSNDSLQSRASSSALQNVKFDQQQIEVETEHKIEPSQRGTSRPDDTIEAFFDLTQESSRESQVDSNEDICNTTTDDPDLSMFTKYKRKHSHNSIDKYRAALNNITSRTSVSSIKDTDKALSSDDLLSSNDELWDTNQKMNRNSFSSKYEYTDPDQSTSNLHRELSNRFSQGKEQINISPQTLSSTESDDREQSPLKLGDIELSDLEIDLSDFSNTKSFNQLGTCRVDTANQGASTSKRKSGNRTFDDEQEIDSLIDIKLEDTDFTIMKNDCFNKNTNISDQDTETECFIESVSDFKETKTVDAIRKLSNADEDKSSDIYNEETDTGEMEDRHFQSRDSGSKMKVDTVPDSVSKRTSKLRSLDKDSCEILSPGYKTSDISSPLSTNFEAISNITGEVDNLLNECRASSEKFRNSQTNLNDSTTQATTSNSLVLASTPRIHRGDSKNINLLDKVSDSEFDDMEFIGHHGSSKWKRRKNKLADIKSPEVENGGKKMNKRADDRYYILDSDSSDSGSSKIHSTKIRASISSANRSKARKKRSTQSRRKSITPEKNSKSSRKTLKVKSVSENIITTKSTSSASFMNDSFDGALARVRTPPIEKQNTSSNNDQKTPQQGVPLGNITPLANYSAMESPELRKELQKYGLKAQKRHRAKQLLRHIYNELHPLVPVEDKNVASNSSESGSEDERPYPKRPNRSNSLEAINSRKNTDHIESDCDSLASDIRALSDASNDIEGLEKNDAYTLSQSDNSEGLENVFRKLIEADRSLHNKILAYEPLVLEELHSTLKAQGLKCKLNALMDFLDEQCITFRTLANMKKNRTRRRASPKKNQGTQ